MGYLIGQVITSALIVAFLSWILGVWIFKGPYRRHHTRAVITTVLGWLSFWYLMSIGPRPEDYFLGAVISGPLVLGIKIFSNPPPLEDEEESEEVE